ncbi:MFS transporter [Halorubellus sp. PRR65]|uniref:MFS transporter n=1 Tax=Halorubellus sp. PRR65 TaxID=3098148 RepID=UPI002B25C9EB|nr:MFS transporter [Halorubellus sp. PRR65]
MTDGAGEPDRSRRVDVLDPFRQFLSLRRDVLVLSVAMLAFSLAFQMTSRYVPEYMRVLGISPVLIGVYLSVGNLVSAVYPYPGGWVSDRVGSRTALTAFGVLSTLGFLVWYAVETVSTWTPFGLALPAFALMTVGLLFTQAWKSFGLGATFAVVKQATEPEHLAAGFASTETFRRVGFLVGPLLATALLAATTGFVEGFQRILLVAVAFGAVATVAQHYLYDASEDTVGDSFAGVSQVIADLRGLPPLLRPLLVGDTFVRFANGMVYGFFVLFVTDELGVGFRAFGFDLRPDAFFGVLLAVEMVVALASMIPVAKLAERVGLKPVVGIGFVVYAAFPTMLAFSPANQWALVALFAFSGLRFAGLPAHKALIVGPAADDAGGRVTGTYYLVRNVVVVPSAALGGVLYDLSPALAFQVASVVGIVGTGYFLLRGDEFEPYA